ncbi:MAG: integron integrase [Verrucomicrobia bacterium]|nr:integron integrase [Verrucomicrobiota bacterium]
MQKLASKNQPLDAQKQAARSVALYYQTMRDAPLAPPGGNVSKLSEPPWDTVFRKLKEEIRVRQYSPKTLATYRIWIEQFRKFLRGKLPGTLTADDAVAYLTHLATEQHVAASTQNQAFNALLFLYRHILKADYDLKGKVVRARQKRYIPVVLTREEVDRVIGRLPYPFNLVVSLLYGCGLRMFEALNLRVGCLNFDDGILTVHDGKGKKDRAVPLPERLMPELKGHMERVSALFERDLKAGFAGVFMPGALDRKWKSASRELVWQWVFPAKTLTYVPGKNEYRRYHMHESVFQKALRAAVLQARIPKRVTAHTFRHRLIRRVAHTPHPCGAFTFGESPCAATLAA